MKKSLVLSVLCACASVGFVMNASAAELDNHSVEGVVVEGHNTIAGGYISTEAKVGGLLSGSVMDIPYSVTSVTNKAVKDFAMSGNNEFMDILTFSPAVRRTTSADIVAIRGKQVKADQMSINGISGMYSNMSMGTNFIERIDVVAGPALLYTGSTSQNVIGGVVNIQAKKAMDYNTNNAALKFTSEGNLQETVDVGERFGKNKEWGVRVNAMNQNGKLATHEEKLDRQNIFVNIDHRAKDNNTNLLAGYAHSKHKGGNMMFQPTANNNPGKIAYLPAAPDGKHNMTPGWAETDSKTWLFTLNHDQKINDNWSAFVNAGFMKNETPISYAGYYNGQTFNFTDKFDGSFDNSINMSASGSTRRYIGAGVKAEHEFGAMKNEFLLAVDKSFHKTQTANSKTIHVMGNLYQNNSMPNPGNPRPATRPGARYTTEGITAVDTMKFFDDKLLISAGVHRHIFRSESYGSGANEGKVTSSRKTDSLCPTYGVVYKFDQDTMVYANHSETFLEGTVVGSSYKNKGEILDPSKTKSNEVGVKFKTGKMLNTVAMYQCKEPTYMAVDGIYGPIGQLKYRGVEFTTAGSLTKKWDLMAGISFARYRVERSSDSKQQGGTQGNGIPKWNANLALSYNADENLSILGRMTYTGTSHIHYGAFEVPSYTRFDIGAKYKSKIGKTPVTYSAMCYNVTNKKGWYSADQGNQLIIADPRTFVVSAEFSF